MFQDTWESKGCHAVVCIFKLLRSLLGSLVLCLWSDLFRSWDVLCSVLFLSRCMYFGFQWLDSGSLVVFIHDQYRMLSSKMVDYCIDSDPWLLVFHCGLEGCCLDDSGYILIIFKRNRCQGYHYVLEMEHGFDDQKLFICNSSLSLERLSFGVFGVKLAEDWLALKY